MDLNLAKPLLRTASLALALATVSVQSAERPNIVFILADDLGYGDLGCYGHPYAKTPNIDRLAKSGTRFTRFYATGVTCQPSRAGFMTSRHPRSFGHRIGEKGFGDRKTITELLRNNGYATGHFGKWHIGPGARGSHVSEKNPPAFSYGIDEIKVLESLKDRTKGRDDNTFEASIDFIERHKDGPFYVNVWAHITHFRVPSDTAFAAKFSDLQVDESLFGPYMKVNKFDICRNEWGLSVNACMKNYLADVWSLDAAIGRLLKKLDQLGLSENTIVIFSSDQGPARNTLNENKPNQAGDKTRANMMGWAQGLRGGKHELYEGGPRIPFIVRWPGKVPVDAVNDTSVLSGLDFLPTLCRLTGTSYDKDQFEGLDVADIWLGGERNPERFLFWKKQYPTALDRHWKYHVNRRDGDELYNLLNDPNETTNVIAKYPEKAASMLRSITTWDESLPPLPTRATPPKRQAQSAPEEPAARRDAPTPASTKNYFNLRNGLKNAQRVFETTKQGTVAFVGGSITGMNWRKLVAADLRRRFPEAKLKFILAGVGSTGSTYGAFRLGRDVLDKGKIDLLFEEAAVNDLAIGRTADEQMRGMEGIVRHARTANPDMDIVMMHFACPSKVEDYNQGRTPEVIASHESVAEHYGVASLDLTLEVTERINRGEFTWKDDFKSLHPSPFGQKLYAKSIARLLDVAWADAPTAATTPHPLSDKLDAFCYDDGKLFPPGLAAECKGFHIVTDYTNKEGGKVRRGWSELPQLTGEKPGDSFTVRFTGTAVGIMVIAGPAAGIIEHSVDGAPWVKRDLFTRHSPRLHLQRLYTLAAELDPGKEHTLNVRISPEKNADSIGSNCRIVYFAINGDPRSPTGTRVKGLTFEGSNGTGPEDQ
ncbi:MAG: sulfatase-like hydrolase/transferase [Lentisphaerae bacterium]|jgi:arylsulfatase A-like enzyme/lysophospholipase L1-like esterase|nr:sulfatase-like hydrolase/transferase [Lentisphaerota bacterium]MBT5611181.1 sulfatase-like hydrolase/transferase [Lentisphaerota bacterium]MBT7054695.1 sulfatase-like hydrolase/transferase [Lentisphaerota bacterium]MBT7841953.1 sulfatase-like hydrolase/transferase [Lentisphaerota bacterium]